MNWPFKRKYRVPGPGWVDNIREKLSNTPDHWELAKKMRHLVFWYNETSPSAGEAFMSGFTKDGFVLYKKNGSDCFPIPLYHKPHHPPTARIAGGLSFLSTDGIISLDKEMKNKVEFNRVRLNIVVPYQQETIQTVFEDGRAVNYIRRSNEKHYVYRAWMYVGMREVWENRLDGGYNFRPVRIHNMPGMGNFYRWTKEELEDS